MKCFPLILVVALITAVANCTFVYGQDSKNATACQDIITNSSTSTLTDRIDGYYFAALCYWKIGDVDNAMLAFAKAEVLGRKTAENSTAIKAREGLEKLYGSLHNGLTIGIEKVYRRAEDSLSELDK